MASSNEKKNRLQNLGGAGILGLLGYSAMNSNLVEDAINSSEKINGLTMGSSRTKTELRQVGESFRGDINALREASERLKKESIERLKESFLNKVESYLEEGDAVSVGDKRAFFAAIFDSMKEEELAGGNGSEIEELIRKGYDSLDDSIEATLSGRPSLDENDRKVLSNFFKNTFSDEEGLERFGKSFQKYRNNIEHFATRSRRQNYGIVAGQQEVGQFSTLEEFFNKSNNYDGSMQTAIKRRYEKLSRRIGNSGAAISFRSYEEGAGDGVKSLYARVEFRGNKVLNIPLFLGKDESGNVIYRATENLSSRYVAPLHVIRADAVLDTTSMTSTRFTTMAEAKANGGIVDFTSYILDDILDNLRTEDILNMSQRRINEITAYERNFGLDAPRTMSFSGVQNGLISRNLAFNLHASRNFQGSNALVAGIERFRREDQRDVVKRLMQFYEGEIIGTNASQTMIARYDNPYDSQGLTKIFSQIGLRLPNSGSLTSFDAVRNFGIKDRVLLEQTAREGQLFGRYESVERIVNLNNRNTASFFGRSNLPVVSVAGEGNLIGVSRDARNAVGMNLSGFFVKGRSVDRLGLAEGVSYFGGGIITSTSMPKTVVESGIANTKLMEELIRLGPTGMRVGGENATMSVDEFFKLYGGEDGKAIIGHLDADFAAIKRRGGIDSFTLGLSEFTTESGRRRYHLVGQMNNLNLNSKLFSWLVKDTTSYADESTMRRKLIEITGSENEADQLIDMYARRMGGRIENTLLSTSAQLKKGVYNATVGMFGSLTMMAGSSQMPTGVTNLQDYLEEQMRLKLSGNQYLDTVNQIYGKSYTSIGQASAKERSGGYLMKSVEVAIGEYKRQGHQDMKMLGHILGSVEEYYKKYGLENEEPLLDLFKREGLGINDDSDFMKGYRSNVIFAAGYGTTGGVHAELGRNLARVEPRFMNYMYANLRTNFNMNSADATEYLSSILIRQGGAESKSVATLGMYTSMMSLSSLPGSEFLNELRNIGNIKKMSLEDLEELKTLGQGNERQISALLSKSEKGQTLDFKDLIADRSRLNRIKEMLGGRTEIFLPGAETLENFEGFKIRGSGQVVEIQSEYTRYLTDLISSINTLAVEKDEKLFEKGLKSFQSSKKYLSTVVGSAVRQSLSGTVLGSGSYMGSGFRFGLDPESGFEFDVDLARRNRMREGILNAFNRKEGYVFFQDAQSFLDGMTTYKEAVKRELRVRGYNGRKLSEDEVHSLTKSLTGKRVKEFFLSIYGEEYDSPTSFGQRNPFLSFNHGMAGISVMRYDFAKGNQDAMFKIFKEYRGTFLNEEGMALYRSKRTSLVRRKIAESQGFLGYDEGEYKSFLEKYKESKERIDALKTRLFGEAEVDFLTGERIKEEVTILDENGNPKLITRTKRNQGTLSGEIIEGKRRIEEVHQRRIQAKENVLSVREQATTTSAVVDATRAKISADQAFVEKIQTPLVEDSYESASERTSRTNLRALQNKIDSAVARGKKNYQSSEDMRLALSNVKEQIRLQKESTHLDFLRLKSASKEEKETITRSFNRNKKRLKELFSLERQIERALLAKEQLEKGTLAYSVDKSSGTIEFTKYSVGRDSKGKRITVNGSTAYGKVLIEDGKVTGFERFSFFTTGEEIDTKRAYEELSENSTRVQESTSGDFIELRKARELDVIRKANQIYQIEDDLVRTNRSIKSSEAAIEEQEGKLSAFLKNKNATEEDLDEAIRSEGIIEEEKERLEKLKRRKKFLDEKLPTIKESLDTLKTSEESSRLTLNRTIASEAVLNRFERNAIGPDGNFIDGFMDEVRGFYGQYDPSKGSARDFLSNNRRTAERSFTSYIESNAGEGKQFRNLTGATRHLLGFGDETFREVEFEVYNKEKGERETVIKRFFATEEEIKEIEREQKAIKAMQGVREEALSDEAMGAARANNAYADAQDELAREQEALKQLETENEENLKLRKMEKAEKALAPDSKTIKISDLESDSIREELSAYRINFEDLDPAEQIRMIEEKRVTNRLNNIEEALRLERNSIDSFESFQQAIAGKENVEVSYEIFDEGEGNKVTRTSTVGEEADKLMLGLLSHHAKYGEHGGGLLYIPELNIEATLTNSATGKTHLYEGRMDLSRFMIGDFDADIYQMFHDTSNVMRKRFAQGTENFHGFYQAGGEYLLSMDVLKKGMANFADRIGTSGMNAEQFILDQYSKERILKDVGPIDVQVKAGMFAMIHNASQAAARSGGDMGQMMKHVRAASALVSVAQEVLVIKSKHLPVASDIADNFLKSLQSSFSTGSADRLIDFFENQVFKGTVYEGKGEVNVSNVTFKDLPDGRARAAMLKALESIKMNKAHFEEALQDMAKTGKDLNILSLMSDKRAQDTIRNSNLTTIRQLRQLLSVSMEGGLIDTETGSLNYDVLERGLRDTYGEMQKGFSMSGKAKGLTGLALGALGASYLVGSSVSTNKLDIEEKFSDIRTKRIESASPQIGNRDHQNNGSGIMNMSRGESFYQRPINVGESYVTNSYAGILYGEAPTYGQAQAAARRFTSVGGQAFISVQDNRQPISNSYISKSLRD